MLGVTAVGKNIREAKDKAYEAAGKISFADAHYRKDIAWRALKNNNDVPMLWHWDVLYNLNQLKSLQAPDKI